MSETDTPPFPLTKRGSRDSRISFIGLLRPQEEEKRKDTHFFEKVQPMDAAACDETNGKGIQARIMTSPGLVREPVPRRLAMTSVSVFLVLFYCILCDFPNLAFKIFFRKQIHQYNGLHSGRGEFTVLRTTSVRHHRTSAPNSPFSDPRDEH